MSMTAASVALDEASGRTTRFEAAAMASPLRLTVATPRDAPSGWTTGLADAWAAVRETFEDAEQAMSRFRDSSDLIGLGRSAGGDRDIAVPRMLERALVTADRARRVTAGRFDPRILADLERLGYGGVAIADSVPGRPTGPVIRRVTRGVVRAGRPVDLGGIGKGLALRWAAAGLERAGIDAYLLEAGGDLVTRGQSPDDGPWRIGIEDPAGGPEPLAVVEPADGAVATSSTHRLHWTHEGREVHHLIDPATGEPAGDGLLAVTVAGPDPAWAEVWSKTLFIGGRGRIAAEARARGLAAWWVAEDGSLEMTAAARARTIWVAAET
jgi:thiamine biosynthesis lipoprotein